MWFIPPDSNFHYPDTSLLKPAEEVEIVLVFLARKMKLIGLKKTITYVQSEHKKELPI